MSETVPTESPVAPVEAPPVEAVTEVPAVVETPVDPTPEPAPEPKKPQGDRRFAIMTAKLKAEETARLSAERERDAALALANAHKDDTAPPKRDAPKDIEAAAAQLVQQREFNERCNAVDASGKAEFADWDAKKEVMSALGASTNTAFLEALTESRNAAKLFAHLADDADALVTLLGKSPTAMAAAIGRMDAEMSRPAARPVSAAPKPITPVTTPAVVAEPTAYDEGLTMKQYAELRAKTAPRHLGGRGNR